MYCMIHPYERMYTIVRLPFQEERDGVVEDGLKRHISVVFAGVRVGHAQHVPETEVIPSFRELY